jgi:hypothetical protein
LKCEDGSVSGVHTYKGSFRDGKLDGKGLFEHGLTKQTFGPNFSMDHFIHTVALDPISSRRARNLSPRSLAHNQAPPPKVLLDLFNLPTTTSQQDFIKRVNKHREDSLRA